MCIRDRGALFNEEGLGSTLENTDERHPAWDGYSILDVNEKIECDKWIKQEKKSLRKLIPNLLHKHVIRRTNKATLLKSRRFIFMT